ncbi:hypothetical protein EJB05_14323, partial [Eragrostis curvula]
MDYIPPDLHSQTDLSALQCIGWTYRSVWIPSDMRIKVVGEATDGCHRKALIYNINLQVENYKYGVGNSPSTNEGYPSTTWEPDCYIDATSIDRALVQRYSRSVVLEGPGIFNEAIVSQIKQTCSFQPIGYQMAIVSPVTALDDGLNLHLSLTEAFANQCPSYIRVTPWSPSFGSVDEVLMRFTRISLNRMPFTYINSSQRKTLACRITLNSPMINHPFKTRFQSSTARNGAPQTTSIYQSTDSRLHTGGKLIHETMDDDLDRISALPRPCAPHHLQQLTYASVVMRTAVLSRQWRHLWTRTTDMDLVDKSDFRRLRKLGARPAWRRGGHGVSQDRGQGEGPCLP